MRTTVIPAQITTVEDKIAGSLNLTQSILLMIPVIFTSLAYAILPTKMHFEIYKLILIFIVAIVSLVLSLRIKDKVVLNWLILFLRYNLRAKYYVFNKNDTFQRDIDLAKTHKKPTRLLEKALSKNQAKLKSNFSHLKDSVKIKNFIKNPNYSLSVKPTKKGGLYVAVDKIQR